MVPPLGIEPSSSVLQTGAMTTFAKAAIKLEYGVGFEPTALRICNPLHWASLPPVHCLAYLQGLEPRLTVLETAVLPLHQRYKFGGPVEDRTPI